MYHAKYLIVDHDLDQWQLLTDCCRNLIHIHTKTSVTGNIDDLLFRISNLCTNCCTKAIFQGTKAAGGQQCMRLT